MCTCSWVMRDRSDRNKERNELDRSIKDHDKSMLKIEGKHRKKANELDEKITGNFTEGMKRKYSDGGFDDDELTKQIEDRHDVGRIIKEEGKTI